MQRDSHPHQSLHSAYIRSHAPASHQYHVPRTYSAQPTRSSRPASEDFSSSGSARRSDITQPEVTIHDVDSNMESLSQRCKGIHRVAEYLIALATLYNRRARKDDWTACVDNYEKLQDHVCDLQEEESVFGCLTRLKNIIHPSAGQLSTCVYREINCTALPRGSGLTRRHIHIKGDPRLARMVDSLIKLSAQSRRLSIKMDAFLEADNRFQDAQLQEDLLTVYDIFMKEWLETECSSNRVFGPRRERAPPPSTWHMQDYGDTTNRSGNAFPYMSGALEPRDEYDPIPYPQQNLPNPSRITLRPADFHPRSTQIPYPTYDDPRTSSYPRSYMREQRPTPSSRDHVPSYPPNTSRPRTSSYPSPDNTGLLQRFIGRGTSDLGG